MMILMIRLLMILVTPISVCFKEGDRSSQVGIEMWGERLKQRGKSDGDARDGKDAN